MQKLIIALMLVTALLMSIAIKDDRRLIRLECAANIESNQTFAFNSAKCA